MNQLISQKILEVCKSFKKGIDEDNDKLIIILDNCLAWLEIVKTKCKHNQNLIVISDTEEFRAFIHENGCKKMYININLDGETGLDLAEELGLNSYFGELFFVSDISPHAADMRRIDKMGGKFVLKRDVLSRIIFPKGE